MRKSFIFFFASLLTAANSLLSQAPAEIKVYLVTCGPGTETYSIYGHSALRVVNPADSSDLVYNWGVFDFDTPNFAWKFAKGRLDYLLDVYPFERFIREYYYEKRWVQSQRINLAPSDVKYLMALITENLKPENRYYRYDFFYDDCSTRIRDLLEEVLGNDLIYPPDDKKNIPTFRSKVGEYQRAYPWLNLGIDLIMGTPGDKKAYYRDVMFLPLDLQKGLTSALVRRDSKMIPLLQNPDTILDFDPPEVKNSFFSSPLFVASMLLILIIILQALCRQRKLINAIDIILFSVFSVLALLMIFFNFFTDHQQMKWNINILWLSPFVISGLLAIILNKRWFASFRTIFILCIISFVIHIIAPGSLNNAFMPLMVVLIIRSSARAGFRWNPFSLHSI